MKRSSDFADPADEWYYVQSKVDRVRRDPASIKRLLKQFPAWRNDILRELYGWAVNDVQPDPALFELLVNDIGMDVSQPDPWWVSSAAEGYVLFARTALPHVDPRDPRYVEQFNPFDALATALDRTIRSYDDAAVYFMNPAFGEQARASLDRVVRGMRVLLPLYFQHGFDHTSNTPHG